METNGTGDLAGNNNKDPGSAYTDNLDEGDNNSGLLDVETPDIPLKRKRLILTDHHNTHQGCPKMHQSSNFRWTLFKLEGKHCAHVNFTAKVHQEKSSRMLLSATSISVDPKNHDYNKENIQPLDQFDKDETDLEDHISLCPNQGLEAYSSQTYLKSCNCPSIQFHNADAGAGRITMTVAVNFQTGAMISTGSQDPKQKTSQKKRPTLLDLPLPRDEQYLHLWHKKFVPLLISWVGSQLDPFNENNALTVGPQSAKNTLNNWHSNMGKAGYPVVSNIFESDPLCFDLVKDQAKHIADSLRNFNFLYKYPEETISMGPVSHNPQVDGLALTAAAVEHGLNFFKTGEDAVKLE
ncbi:hypothetical protein EI94DRAFT_1697154 [Lactarius quietus]|nr:hypothetical protein EI94DRAFT_1697154 [Lactarius quietus]